MARPLSPEPSITTLRAVVWKLASIDRDRPAPVLVFSLRRDTGCSLLVNTLHRELERISCPSRCLLMQNATTTPEEGGLYLIDAGALLDQGVPLSLSLREQAAGAVLLVPAEDGTRADLEAAKRELDAMNVPLLGWVWNLHRSPQVMDLFKPLLTVFKRLRKARRTVEVAAQSGAAS